ncbi:hypothetical protein WICANDRAFT_64676 [Wickerhamomyces anomalus NRRL Y-366-8]|uniref:Uncharacterized protein n=1 Tax=Wickerhamomyces anomalus (strain ATCC 58044 / CBS 1984 / NCYC 433 / NRRL Y-366-8) TaxID=683960 RepID=A0A1E3NZ72_WICAA|nr:uncharacterized protein WICANDRAFT_64676 [Wickerhamomyces anomalus NRRL Y-366-8]ODQ58541.1 hypothetical protein WICANDRAFT_64676 [Wickerhamomyces anomalus NRRL Y-366-8]
MSQNNNSSVQPLHPILDSKENVTKARVHELAVQQKLKYVSPSDKKENLSPTSKKLMDHKLKHLYKNPVKKLSGLRLEAAVSSDEEE